MAEQQAANILVVDDEPAIRELLCHWLTTEGYECATASDAAMALEMLEQDRLDLLISDIMMPGVSGIELLSIVRNRYPETAVMMATAVDDRNTAITTLQLGAYGYVIKPFDKNDLLITVASALERRRLTLVSRDYERALEARVLLNEKYGKLVHVFPIGIAEFVLPEPASCKRTAEELLPIIFNAKVTQGNRELAKQGGWDDVEALQGLGLGEVFPQDEENLSEYAAWIEGCFSTHSFETKEQGPGREQRYFENTLVGIIRDEHLSVFWAMRRDITAARRVQDALAERLRTIDALYEHVLQAGKAKAIMDHTAEVAHELRQPLAIIGGFARRLDREAASENDLRRDSVRDTLKIVIREVERLEGILGSLIDYTRHERVRPKRANPNELLRYAVDVHRPQLDEKNLRVETSFGGEVEEIRVDPDRIQQVIRNLLANAIEASPVGSVIRVDTRVSVPINRANSFGLVDPGRYFEIRIHNYGRAISPDNLRKIFDPFFTTKDYGTGMGLTLAKKIVEDHRGYLSLKSDENGTIATVWIPLTRTTARWQGVRDDDRPRTVENSNP